MKKFVVQTTEYRAVPVHHVIYANSQEQADHRWEMDDVDEVLEYPDYEIDDVVCHGIVEVPHRRIPLEEQAHAYT